MAVIGGLIGLGGAYHGCDEPCRSHCLGVPAVDVRAFGASCFVVIDCGVGGASMFGAGVASEIVSHPSKRLRHGRRACRAKKGGPRITRDRLFRIALRNSSDYLAFTLTSSRRQSGSSAVFVSNPPQVELGVADPNSRVPVQLLEWDRLGAVYSCPLLGCIARSLSRCGQTTRWKQKSPRRMNKGKAFRLMTLWKLALEVEVPQN
jgi:hypothetical protein